ncbi:MAG: glycosyltransferase [Pseudomonadota bacterium]
MKALFWVQHLLGIGHMRRGEALVKALIARGVDVTVIQGGFPVPGVPFTGAEVEQLPPVRAADAAFATLIGSDGQPISDQVRANRIEQILACFERVRPDIVMTESFPFGRRHFRHELAHLLDRIGETANPPVVIACVRDVLVGKRQKEKERWMADQAQQHYDQVIIHGDPSLIPFETTFPFTEQISNLLFYSGYVAPMDVRETDRLDANLRREIVVSGGGSATAGPLFEQVLRAIPLCHQGDDRWRFLMGPDLPAAIRQRLITEASQMREPVQVDPAVPSLAKTLRSARLSISQAGYNTVMDILSSGVRAIVVPFAGEEESEQTLRARVLADYGRLFIVTSEEAADPHHWASAMKAALAGDEPESLPIMMDGAARTADRIIEAARAKRANTTVART